MLQIDNDTPFAAHLSVIPNEAMIDTLLVVLKASFMLGDTLEISAAQLPITLADEYWGEPGCSSLKYAGEVHLPKRSTDVVLVGEACSLNGPVTRLDVKVIVAERSKTVRVFGDRTWVSYADEIYPGRPTTFQRMPLVYERAFGGCSTKGDPAADGYEPRNPVGVGFFSSGDLSRAPGTRMPNLEDPRQLLRNPAQRPAPACFGYVAPSWAPRVAFAGSYGPSWQRSRAPYLPIDFDAHFLSTAPPDFSFSRFLVGGEPVSLVGVSPVGPLRFRLPICEPVVTILVAGELARPAFHLETLQLEPLDERVCLLYRAALPCDKAALKIKMVKVSLRGLSFPE